MDIRELGNRIKEQRERRQLRQADIAGALRISAQAVSKWERGENAPDIAVLPELTRLLGVSIEWLLGCSTPDTETFSATVFCTSLNGFAEKSAAMPPRDVASWANGIYYNLTEALLRHDGIPVKYVGDGSLGFFAGAGHEQRAFDAAILARKTLGTPDLVITLNSGDIFLGTIGHPDYASSDVIGAAVNTAFLCMPWVAANCRTGIGLTASVAAGLNDAALAAKRGEIDVPGVQGPLEIFEPVTK